MILRDHILSQAVFDYKIILFLFINLCYNITLYSYQYNY